jgi:hypothetical protein
MFARFCELRWLYRVLPILLVGCAWATGQCNAQTDVLAHQVKAAMLYKFLAYVEWPPDTLPTPVSPYVIAVAGADEMAGELRHITANRSVNDRPIIVRNVSGQDDLDGIHLLFVGQGAAARLQESLLRRVAHQATMTVTESESGLMQDSIINFRPLGDRIGFDVSLIRARERNLRLSARLLAVASYVETGEP